MRPRKGRDPIQFEPRAHVQRTCLAPHSGGVLADAALPNQTLHGIRAAFAPKVSSAQLWQQPVGMQPSVMHLLFSSVAALLGSPGQANYSAANASLDTAAQRAQAALALTRPDCSDPQAHPQARQQANRCVSFK